MSCQVRKKTSETFPGEHQTLNYQMEKLRREVRELGRLIAKESGLERLVEWIDMVIFRWRLKRNIRKNRR